MDTISILDFGGQYTHLIANRIRRLKVYSEILPNTTPAADLKRFKGIILSGSPHSVTDAKGPGIDAGLFLLGIPVLGLCYGHQLMAKTLGGTVISGDHREYGRAHLTVGATNPLLDGLDKIEQIWMSHGDSVDHIAPGFSIIGSTGDCPAAAVGDDTRRFYGLQFHPEVTDTPHGMKILDNFITICDCARTWDTNAYIEEISQDIIKKCGNRKVFLLVSGGVDSTVAFALLNKVLGPQRVLGVHIDTGLMRHGESADIMTYMNAHGFSNLQIQDASADFVSALAGIADPEQKRKIIGNKFLEVKEQVERDAGLNAEEWILAQGTIYPDTIESAGTAHADKIKTHHNRVDLILELLEKGLVIEPLAQLYKDEVRALGTSLGLPHPLIWRHPFPGPGLGVRVLCSDGLAEPVDAKMTAAISKIAHEAGYQAAILPIRSVGVQGDSRTYAHPVVLSGLLDYDALDALSTKITNSVRGINRVVYAVSVAPEMKFKLAKAYMTTERLDNLRAFDHLVTKALEKFTEYEDIWQMPVVLLPLLNSNNKECVVLRPVNSQEAMTARFARLKQATLSYIVDNSRDMHGIGDILLDVTHKPPGTIEWE